MVSKRIKKVNNLISFEIANIVHEIFPDHIISIRKAETSSDLSYVKVTFSSLSKDKKVASLLNNRSNQIRRELARKISLSKTPKIHFTMDEKDEAVARIDQLLNEVGNSQ